MDKKERTTEALVASLSDEEREQLERAAFQAKVEERLILKAQIKLLKEKKKNGSEIEEMLTKICDLLGI